MDTVVKAVKLMCKTLVRIGSHANCGHIVFANFLAFYDRYMGIDIRIKKISKVKVNSFLQCFS